MKFRIENKGTITQGLAQNLNPSYKENGLIGHTGVDYTLGWRQPVFIDNPGIVYKVFSPQERDDNWVGVYILTQYLADDGFRFMEICYGHLNEVFVKEGDKVQEGEIVGLQGNYGTVYSGGTQITPRMQDNGDQRGSHVHESWRRTKRVKTTVKGEYYLEDKRGRKYQDKDGYYYQIIDKDNGLRGHMDPIIYTYKDTLMEKIKLKLRAVKQLRRLKDGKEN